MYTIKENYQNELIINKSRFISYAYKVNNVLEVTKILEDLKQKHKDATHYCYAYVIGNKKRFNDDKEPSHTAGMPILNVLESKELNNVLVIVVRYFGGVKLGAGGLTRAYSSSASEVLKDENIIVEKEVLTKRIEFDYKDVNTVNYILKDYKIAYKEFDENIVYEFLYESDNYPSDIDKYIIKKN